LFQVLEACLIAERPFLTAKTQYSMRMGITVLEFQYLNQKIQLIRSNSARKDECLTASKDLLRLLPDLVSDSNELYNGVVWQLLYHPFRPFFVLFGEMLSTETCESSYQSLHAMEQLPSFLSKMVSRHPQAAKLHTLAEAFVEYAKKVCNSASTQPDEAEQRPSTFSHYGIPNLSGDFDFNSTVGNGTAWQEFATASGEQSSKPLMELFNDPAMQDVSMDMDFWFPNPQTTDKLGQAQGVNDGMLPTGGNKANPYDFFADSTFDWLSWDAQTL
jgi:hypothetical protein